MTAQMTFLEKFARELQPDSRRTNPVVWIRQIAILKKLEPGKANEVRRIGLHLGLNILWAPPEDPSTEVILYGDGLSGHASGKTLFCRLLRYLLGEPNYGTEALMEAVARKFEELWVLGEVMVEKQLWLVVRPLTPRLHRFAIKGCTIDDYLATKPEVADFAKYHDALEAACCGTILKEQGKDDPTLGWRYLLPWLARDQESRFSSITDWRDSLSGADQPKTSATEQQTLMRAVLRLLAREEKDVRSNLEKNDADAEEKQTELPRLQALANADETRLRRTLDTAKVTGADLSDLKSLPARIESLQTERQKRLATIEAAGESEEVRKSRIQWQKSVNETATLSARIQSIDLEIPQLEKLWTETQSQWQKQMEAGMTDAARKAQGFCPRSLPFAIDRGCVEKPKGASLESEMELGEIQLEGDKFKEQIALLKSERAQKQTSLERVEATQEETFRAYADAQARDQVEANRLRGELTRLNACVERIGEAKQSRKDVLDREKEIAELNSKRDDLKKEIDTLRATQATAETAFSYLFADAVRAVMGGSVTALASLSDRGISLKVERNGDLSGAALETIKTIAFDLAAMVSSMEGRSHHPRFLIHDGPREADMARVIYERFFLYAKRLEESFGKDREPNFQYIVTTTTPPPTKMQQGSRWLLDPVLDGAKPEKRLLKVEL
jgi:hypothetical protein